MESQIAITADGSQAVAEFQRIVAASLKSGDSIEAALKKGAAAYEAFGTSSEKASRKQQQAAKRIEEQAARQMRIMETGGRHTAAFLEAEAKARNALTPAVEKQIAALRKLEQAQRTAAQAGAISAGQYANAMRMVPAQMTDIVTQLAGGQNPLMIALQQGGQLRDSFGSFGAMFKGLSSVITPARLALGGFAAAAVWAGKAIYEGAENYRAFENALALTGKRAGLTADMLEAMTRRLDSQNRAYGENRQAVMALVQDGTVSAAMMEQTASAVVSMSRATGESIEDMAKLFSNIAKDPIKSIQELSSKYGVLNGEIYRAAQALVNQGREQEAVNLVIRAAGVELDELGKKVESNKGFFARLHQQWKDDWKEIYDWLSGLGVPDSKETVLAAKEQQLQERLTRGPINETVRAAWEKGNQQLRNEIEAIRREVGAIKLAESKRGDDATRIAGNKDLDTLGGNKLNRHEQYAKAMQDAYAAYKKAITGNPTEAEIYAAINKYNKAAAEALKARDSSAGAAQQYMKKLEQQYKLPAGLLDAVWNAESSRGRNMKSGAGAQGHFQFMPETARMYGIRGQEYDFKASAEAAAKMYADLLKANGGSLERALASYNWGIGNLQTKGIGAMPKETRDYIAKITKQMRIGLTGDDEIPDAPKLSEFQKTQAQHERTMIGLRAQAKALQDGTNESQAKYIALISSEAYQNMPEAEKAKAVAMARAEDALISQNEAQKKAIENEKRFNEAIQQSTAAMQQQLAVEAQRYAADLAGMGKGQQWRDRAAAEQQINDRYQTERNKIADDLRRGQIGQGQYDEWLAKIDETNRVALEMDRGYWQQRLANQGDWTKGATEALQNYADQVANISQSTEQMFTNAFQGMEDALVQFVTKGKLDFKSLADSIIADMVRIAIQQSITGPLAKWAGGLFSGMAGGDIFFGNALGGVYNSPGLSAYSGQIVSKPTLFPFAKGTGLMGEAGPEAILPLKRGPGGYLGVRAEGGGDTVNITVNVADGGSAQIDPHRLTKAIQATVQREIATARRNGGVLA